MLALQEELRMPLIHGEGPLALVVCPFHGLAKQTFDVVEEFAYVLKGNGNPNLRSMLCIGGTDIRPQIEVMKKGVHIVVATPGCL